MTELILRDERLRQTAIDLLSRLDLARPWRVTVVRYVKKRSMSQNALAHLWFTIIANEIGDSADSVKYDLKMMFLEKVELTSRITGEIRLEPKHTSQLDTREMTNFIAKIDAFAMSQLGIMLPHPEELHLRDVA